MSTKNPSHQAWDPAHEARQPQKSIDLGEFGLREFRGAIDDVRSALIDEAWFDRTSASVTHVNQSLGWDLPEDRDSQRAQADRFADRWSASDHSRQREERDHPHELDFER